MNKVLLVVLATSIPITAQAYFDPGTGSLLIQALIGGLAAVTVFWGRVKHFLIAKFSNKETEPTADTECEAAED